MADPQQPPAPLTGSLRSDVLLLSTYLSGKQCIPSERHRKDATMSLYLHISTLLAIGNASNRQAENVNAIIGETSQTAVQFLVCAENAGQHAGKAKDIRQRLKGHHPQGGNDKGMDSPTESVEIAAENKEGSANGAERPVIPNGVHGKELLEEWEEGATIGASTLAKWVVHLSIEWLTYMILSNFTFGAHLQDLFDVIVSLKPGNSKDLKNFQHFIHHRAYRKLGWRVLDFSTHWGKLPFDIISECLAKSELESKDFTFKEVFNNAIQMHMPSRASSETNSKPVYCLNSDNALQWLNVVYTLWETLQKKLLGEGKPKLREIKTPTPEAVCEIVYALMGLEAMMPVLKHLLSAEGVVGALAENELLAYLSRTAKSSGDKSLAPDTDGGDGDERVEPDTDDRDEDNLESMLNNRFWTHETSVDRLLHAMRTVLAWRTSCKYIFEKATYFQSQTVQWKLSQFCYGGAPFNPTAFDADNVLSLLREWQEPANDLDIAFARDVIYRTLNAKVHAEAALMDWIVTVKDVPPSRHSRSWPIGVSKKSCRLCWLLHLAYNKRRETQSQFVLPGTHGTFCAWLPPPGIPDDILLELRDELLAACKTFVPGHSRHSSASSATSDAPVEEVTPDNFLTTISQSACQQQIALGKTATYGAAQAKLILLGGKDMGPHLFFVQLRPLGTHHFASWNHRWRYRSQIIQRVKVLCATLSAQDMRRSMGGHGCSAFSGVSRICADMVPSATYEGENFVLDQQAARAALKTFRDYLHLIANAPSSPSPEPPILKDDDSSPPPWIQMPRCIRELQRERRRHLMRGEMVSGLKAQLELKLKDADVLRRLHLLYLQTTAESALAGILSFGLLRLLNPSRLGASRDPTRGLRMAIARTCVGLLPEAMGLTGALGLLNSALGCMVVKRISRCRIELRWNL
ncbi:hypothetical protein BT96DRAFT_1007955 [Gymnopus androsaceus JB14]|uniref:Acyl-CoA oxidase C-alpha1 domain-containing protein n=1 Tax=Gymnopus androsaceus JB14 TaxID=1447944 RepID=A0A6A4GGP8_9AGAR|nr:hypothetical protein BT96DRAFT_1007955 [Gymnopus androsaceus JB14]